MSSKGRYKNFLYLILLILVSLFVSAMLGETILRLLGHHGAPVMSMRNINYVNDPILDWRNKPNSVRKFGGNVVYKYNNSGFRDLNHTLEKPQGISRIVVLGDSVTEGYGVKWQAMFTQVLQSKLGHGFEVINISAGGLNTPQEVYLFEQEGLAYKPDLVIVNFVMNDVDFYTNFKGIQRFHDQKNSEIGLLNIRVNPKFKQFLKSSALIYFVKDRLENLKYRIVGRNEGDYFTKLWASEKNRDKAIYGFEKLHILQKKNQFNVLVIIWPIVTSFDSYSYGSIHTWIEKEANKMKFETLDLLPCFSKIPYRKLQVSSVDNIHPNALGHKIAAEAFMKWYSTNNKL